MLSIYVPTDEKGNIDPNQEIDEEKWIQKTFVSVRYRCAKRDELNKSLNKSGTKKSKTLRMSFKSGGSNADNDSESE